jgi:hypothetical protein
MQVKEIEIEKYLVKKVSELDGHCIKLTGYKGIPDRMLLLPNVPPAFIELKRPAKGVYSSMQNWWDSWLKENGHHSFRASTKEEVDECLRKICSKKSEARKAVEILDMAYFLKDQRCQTIYR